MYLSRIFTRHRSPASGTEYNEKTLLLTWSFRKLGLEFEAKSLHAGPVFQHHLHGVCQSSSPLLSEEVCHYCRGNFIVMIFLPHVAKKATQELVQS